MAKLILLRHFKSQWNLENRFTGWVDVPLMRADFEIPALDFDVVYTSPLIRNLHTVLKVFEKKDKYPIFRHFKGKMKNWTHFEELGPDRNNISNGAGQNYIQVFVSEALNERYYGKLQGLNKEETMKKYGKEKVHLWRRSYNIAPPEGESLADVVKRTMPFYKKYVEKDLRSGKNVLIVASHNSARAIIKYIEKVSDKDIINVEMPFGGLRQYEFDKGVYNVVR
ncbi:MAG: phosphoglycerate mutase [Candidatus Nealsonbacteria bacterium CG_4_9_14_3_um_filter_37_13]|uniref:phosphoglycerate mutase (2,3-diphosphoglycerate-dependent) n=1 Tax=Candidatus Nealsonbacteria bacterium CG_4_9_14_3_um_filter_37_13 TaxID=1974695 RepID=A0A2M7Z5S6_9BACT|nr:MAG: phosphoglycerate mutase [Candidatus Nealsonbacteria bacterium CG_4_9_14_3_um_filter_37_13]